MKNIKAILILSFTMALFGIGASPRPAECRINSTRAMIECLKTACDLFELDTGQYPTEQQGLAALLVDPGVTNWQGPYLRSNDNAPPRDPWDKDFRYRVVEGKPVIESSGPDGIFDTEDDNGNNWKPKPRTAGCATVHFADPHGHVVDVHARPWKADIPEARLVWVDPPPSDQLSDVVTNQSATARAYIVQKTWLSNSHRDHVQIEMLDSGRVWEVEGLPLEHRPISDLVWIEDRYLVFDRWSQPHYGMHYVVDTLKKKLILATPFPDQFYLDQQKPNEQPAGF